MTLTPGSPQWAEAFAQEAGALNRIITGVKHMDHWGNMSKKEQKALKAAHAKGKIIEFYREPNGKWVRCHAPSWFGDLAYRVAPEPQWPPKAQETPFGVLTEHQQKALKHVAALGLRMVWRASAEKMWSPAVPPTWQDDALYHVDFRDWHKVPSHAAELLGISGSAGTSTPTLIFDAGGGDGSHLHIYVYRGMDGGGEAGSPPPWSPGVSIIKDQKADKPEAEVQAPSAAGLTPLQQLAMHAPIPFDAEFRASILPSNPEEVSCSPLVKHASVCVAWAKEVLRLTQGDPQ